MMFFSAVIAKKANFQQLFFVLSAPNSTLRAKVYSKIFIIYITILYRLLQYFCQQPSQYEGVSEGVCFGKLIHRKQRIKSREFTFVNSSER